MYNSRPLHLNPCLQCSIDWALITLSRIRFQLTKCECELSLQTTATYLCRIFYTRQETHQWQKKMNETNLSFPRVPEDTVGMMPWHSFRHGKKKRGTLKVEMGGCKVKGTERSFQVCLKGKEAEEATSKSWKLQQVTNPKPAGKSSRSLPCSFLSHVFFESTAEVCS